MTRVGLLGAVAPREGEAERERLVAAFEAGPGAMPRWTYAPGDYASVRRRLSSLACELERTSARNDALARLYAARARELELEARLASCVGTAEFGILARERFAAEAEGSETAKEHALRWIGERAAPHGGPVRTSDGPEPESLVSRMREAIGRHRAPFAVEVRRDLSSLAATGERAVFVAAGRLVDDEDVRRTVTHEVEAHILPRVRAQRLSCTIFRIGTAGGTDDQEGLAVALEERHDFLGKRRKRELAARHIAALVMDDGASFVECVRVLEKDHAFSAREAVYVAERVYRGGDGVRPGLGRERVYLTSFARVRAYLAAHPEDELLLSSGQVAVNAIEALRMYFTRTGAQSATTPASQGLPR